MTGIDEAEARLRATIREFLALEEDLDGAAPLGEAGIDSLTAAELSATIEDRYGVVIPMERFLGGDTLRDVAEELLDAERAAG